MIRKKCLPFGSVLPPKGYVYLGVGGSFKTDGRCFRGLSRSKGQNEWTEEGPYFGSTPNLEYAAKANSRIVKAQSTQPTKAKKKIKPGSKKTIATASGPLDPKGIPQHEPGAKMDEGKDMAGLMWGFSRALEAIVKVGTYGAKKYTRDGWNHVPDAIQRYQDAADRHTLAMGRGEELDPESGLPHEWHATWNRLAVLELKLRQQKS